MDELIELVKALDPRINADTSQVGPDYVCCRFSRSELWVETCMSTDGRGCVDGDADLDCLLFNNSISRRWATPTSHQVTFCPSLHQAGSVPPDLTTHSTFLVSQVITQCLAFDFTSLAIAKARH